MRAAQVAVDAEEEAQRREGATRTADTPEDRELRELAGRANAGLIFDAALEHRSTDGAERELQEHYHLASNQVPLILLEQRAVTPAPANVGQNQGEIIPGVFPASAAAFVGVDMPTVPVGEAIFPVLTTNATVGVPAEGASAGETTGAFSAEVPSPSRLQASFFYSREDRARFAGMDAALRMNLSDAIQDSLDAQVLAGTNGLLTGTNLADNAASSETDYAGYLSGLCYGRVDGVFAPDAMMVRSVVGPATYAHAASIYRNNSVDRNVIDRLKTVSGGCRVSAHVPAVASTKQNAVVRLGMRRDMVAPLWEGLTLIPDEVTKADSGEIVITAVMLHAVKILRSGGFYKFESQHA